MTSIVVYSLYNEPLSILLSSTVTCYGKYLEKLLFILLRVDRNSIMSTALLSMPLTTRDVYHYQNLIQYVSSIQCFNIQYTSYTNTMYQLYILYQILVMIHIPSSTCCSFFLDQGSLSHSFSATIPSHLIHVVPTSVRN